MARMSRPLARALIVLIALAHAAFFIVYQRPDWPTQWTDQNGYLRLGRAISQTGHFTRYPDDPRFIPEVLRTPGYPLFVAAVDLTLGEGQLPVAIAQAGLYAGICLLVYAAARLVARDGVAFAAGLATALYPPLPYYGALTLTELFTSFVVTLGVYFWLRALRGGVGWAAGAGAALAWAALTRPTFQFLLVALILFGWLVAPRRVAVLRAGAVALAVSVVVVAPWIRYNAAHLDRVAFSPPAAGIGRTLWEGNWQIALPGRVEATLTHLAETIWDRPSLDARVRAYADQLRRDPEPMLRYVHQWQDVRTMWDRPQDPMERTVARVAADHEYERLALDNIRRHPLAHIRGRATRAVALLWIAEIPVRYSDINQLPPMAIRAMWLAQAALMAASLAGLVVLWRWGARAEAAALAALVLYVTAVHVVLYSEARYALPAKPAVLLLATVAVAHAIRGRDAAGGS
jgi:4-amino-4-deoxy-L-arabinose transferase-like glycosyltransferase